MRVLLTTMLLVGLTASAGLAQEHAGIPAHDNPFRIESPGEPARKVLDKKFWVMAAALNTAMTLDTKSTFDVVRTCRGCREANPLVAPFVRRGPALTFTSGEFFDAGVMTLAAKMKSARRSWVRRTWWVAPAALVVGHSIAYRHNVNLLKK
ncbi:MAG: hypothetical protein ABI634_02280 [Acidobacteriota bacterium]